MAQIIDLGKFRFNWMGDFDIATEYERNDTVKYGGNVYVYTLNAASTGNLPTDTDFWALMLEGFNFRGEWSSVASYELSDLVTYGGKVYLALRDTVNDNPATAGADWQVFVEGIQWEGEWSSLATYQVGDVVKYGGVVYIATANSSNSTPNLTSVSWEVLVYGLEYKGTYNDATGYKLNDIVLYGGTSYIALQPGTGNEPTPGAYWDIFTSGFQWEGEWSDATQYQTGDLTRYGGVVYVASQDVIGTSPTDEDYWEVFTEGIAWKGAYSGATTYNKNDIVASAGSSWIAKQNTNGNAPVVGVNWDILAAGTFPSLAGQAGKFLSTNGSIVQWVSDVTVDALTANDNLYVGPGAEDFDTSAGLTNALAVYRFDNDLAENSFAQIAFTNADPTSSTDLQLFMNNGDDNTGWIDLGITGSTFNDPSYPITYAGDGYIFVNGKSTYRGNLVFGTGGGGTQNKIIFAAGGYSSGNTQMTITPDESVKVNISTASTSPTTGALQVVGGVGIQGDMNIQGNVSIVGAITFGGSGTTTVIDTVSSTDPVSRTGANNPDDLYDLGIVGEYAVAVTNVVRTVSNKALTANVATLTTTVAHTYSVGDVVVVTGVDATFNGTVIVTGVTSTTFSYSKTATNVVSVASSGTATKTRSRRWRGMVRDASDGIVKLFAGSTVVPGNTVDFTNAGLVYSDMKLGALEGTTLTATTGVTSTAGTNALKDLTLSGTGNTFGTSSIAGNYTVTGNPTYSGAPVFSGNPSFTGVPTFTGGVRVQEMIEDVADVTHSSNVMTLDYSTGNIFYLTNTPSGNMTVNVTNAPTDNGRVFTVNLVVTQGATGYIPTYTAFTINGTTSSLRWAGGTAPTPTSSSGKVDIFTFTIIRRGSAWIPLGSANTNF